MDSTTNEGKGIFFQRYFKTPLTDEERSRLNGIANLTPGDFRTVRGPSSELSRAGLAGSCCVRGVMVVGNIERLISYLV